MSIRIDGKQISAQIKDELKERVKKENLEVTLAVIQVGNDPASTVYVGIKKSVPWLMNCRRKHRKKNCCN